MPLLLSIYMCEKLIKYLCFLTGNSGKHKVFYSKSMIIYIYYSENETQVVNCYVEVRVKWQREKEGIEMSGNIKLEFAVF